MTSIDVRDLTKDYGTRRAVDDLSFTVRPGRVTGFLGPNGAGKSTTMRLVLGLDRPTAGTATVGGRPIPPWTNPCGWSVPCSTRTAPTARAPHGTTCASWRRATAYPPAGSTR